MSKKLPRKNAKTQKRARMRFFSQYFLCVFRVFFAAILFAEILNKIQDFGRAPHGASFSAKNGARHILITRILLSRGARSPRPLRHPRLRHNAFPSGLSLFIRPS